MNLNLYPPPLKLFCLALHMLTCLFDGRSVSKFVSQSVCLSVGTCRSNGFQSITYKRFVTIIFTFLLFFFCVMYECKVFFILVALVFLKASLYIV